MIEGFKPLLAVQAEFDKVDFTDMVASPKLDGIRAIVIDGVVMSRNLKPIPNQHVQNRFKHLEHYDGELICGSPTSPSVYRDSNSAVMSRDGTPEVTFYVFDHIQFPDSEYEVRSMNLWANEDVVVLPQIPVRDKAHLDEIEAGFLEQGYEGLMLRKARGPNSKYKFGRATAKSNTLLKVKRFADAEYEVIGYVERMENQNEKTTDALGHSKRSSHQENKVGRGDLGALVCHTADGLRFNVGTGFDDDQRRKLWEIKDDGLIGQWVKVKSFLIGVKDAPRFPVFLGFRDKIDL